MCALSRYIQRFIAMDNGSSPDKCELRSVPYCRGSILLVLSVTTLWVLGYSLLLRASSLMALIIVTGVAVVAPVVAFAGLRLGRGALHSFCLGAILPICVALYVSVSVATRLLTEYALNPYYSVQHWERIFDSLAKPYGTSLAVLWTLSAVCGGCFAGLSTKRARAS